MIELQITYRGDDPKKVFEILKRAATRSPQDFMPRVFSALQDIMDARFRKGGFAPKKRAFIHGDTPLIRGIKWDGNNPTYRAPEFHPSLTSPSSKYSIRVIGPKSYFGTSYPWAVLLDQGGMVARIRISPKNLAGKTGGAGLGMSLSMPGLGSGMMVPRAGMPSLGFGFGMGGAGAKEKKQFRGLHYRDDFGVWQDRIRTEDRGFVEPQPARPILRKLDSSELAYVTDAYTDNLNEWLRGMGLRGAFRRGS